MKSCTIRVDRSVLPAYPPQAANIVHPELELVGPEEYDLASLVVWCHEGQKDGEVRGSKIYEYLKGTDSLRFCLGVKDAEALQEQQEFVELLRTVQAVLFWSAVAEDVSGEFYVLCAQYVPPSHPFESGPYRPATATLQWAYLDEPFGRGAPALMHRVPEL